jgi:hypothetical protein
MAIAIERAVPSPRPWLTASRVLLIASGELLIHGIAGRGRRARLSRRNGRLVRS